MSSVTPRVLLIARNLRTAISCRTHAHGIVGLLALERAEHLSKHLLNRLQLVFLSYSDLLGGRLLFARLVSWFELRGLPLYSEIGCLGGLQSDF